MTDDFSFPPPLEIDPDKPILRMEGKVYAYLMGKWSTWSLHRDMRTGRMVETLESGVYPEPVLIATGEEEP